MRDICLVLLKLGLEITSIQWILHSHKCETILQVHVNNTQPDIYPAPRSLSTSTHKLNLLDATDAPQFVEGVVGLGSFLASMRMP
ncbi:hypothetical protein AAZX31_08G024300 [Glycine max]|uniref:Uncharacterized protein n=1 Tax=Glycine max TaxID=3847 RepID=K7L4K5_SOYBN|nr:hypothetical protein JHK87_020152 [Glycine soja]KAH1049277.1 hypothetical protein GYH30_020023 [Glycine max]KRH41345.1 hypothetical protein GLYMA_08G024500v4 [Glycine max]